MVTEKTPAQRSPSVVKNRTFFPLQRSQLLLVICLLLWSVTTVLALPPAVELDRLLLHAKTALDAKAYDVAIEELAQAQKLGIALPENFALGYATALAGVGRMTEAKGVLEEYFNKYETKGSSYQAVLALLVQIEDQERGIAKTPVRAAPLTATVGTGSMQPDVNARPQLPVAVSEEVWRTIETSEAYRNLPPRQAYKISYQTSGQITYTGSKSAVLPKPAATRMNFKTEVTPLEGKFLRQRTSYSLNSANPNVTEDYSIGGLVSLVSTIDGKPSGFIKSLDELSGSLFPIRIGNQRSIRYHSAYVPDRKFDSTIASTCQVVSQGAARELHPSFTGEAWKVRCQNSYTSDYNQKLISSEIDDYYLEDLGLMLSAIGQLNFPEKKFFMPQPGDQTDIIAPGEYGSRNTTTYLSYDWSLVNDAPEQATFRPSPSSLPKVAASADWGLVDRDLSIMTGAEIMKKVHMAEQRGEILAAAQAGDKVGQYLIGASYEYGIGVEKDAGQKVLWLTKAAEQGLIRARAALANARITGSGTPQDDLSGWGLLLEASNAGNGIAQYLAAIYTLRGVDVGDGRVKQYSFLEKPVAVKLLRQSAEAGVAPAEYALGYTFLKGTEFNSKDLTQARYWLERAAAQNLSQAVTALAEIP